MVSLILVPKMHCRKANFTRQESTWWRHEKLFPWSNRARLPHVMKPPSVRLHHSDTIEAFWILKWIWTLHFQGQQWVWLSREGFVCCRLSLDFGSQAVCTLIIDTWTFTLRRLALWSLTLRLWLQWLWLWHYAIWFSYARKLHISTIVVIKRRRFEFFSCRGCFTFQRKNTGACL